MIQKYGKWLCSIIALTFAASFIFGMQKAGSEEPGTTMTPEMTQKRDALFANWQKKNVGFSKPSDDKLQEKLSPVQYKVTQKDGTERPFQNEYWDNKQEGIYVDIVSGEPLFSSTDKYKSGTGWPSFTRSISESAITTKADFSLFGERTELRSRVGDSHLGHVFDDGPAPTGKRYCINSASLRFIPKEELEKEGYSEFLTLFEN